MMIIRAPSGSLPGMMALAIAPAIKPKMVYPIIANPSTPPNIFADLRHLDCSISVQSARARQTYQQATRQSVKCVDPYCP
jgi:hypothetical protein